MPNEVNLRRIAAVPAQLAEFVVRAGGAFAERLWARPIASVDDLSVFVGQRSSLVAQTTLYGYLKTRMGTKFVRYFEDEVFSAGIKEAAVRQFLSCASDLSIHAAAVVADNGRLERDAAAGLARRCFATATAQGLEDVEPRTIPPDMREAFAVRAGRTVWASAASGEAAFAGSIEDLIRNAPVVDEFKVQDAPIVRNSIRFRWLDVRKELGKRLDPGAVADDWTTDESH